jgi:hypothetical protein
MDKPKIPTQEEIQAAVQDFGSQTDRGVAIVAVSILEQILEAVLTLRMMPLSKKSYAAIFGKMAPLSSFAAKLEMALALGVILPWNIDALEQCGDEISGFFLFWRV